MITWTLVLGIILGAASAEDVVKGRQATVGFFPSNIFNTRPEDSLTYFNVVFLNQVGQSLVAEDRAGAIIPSIAKNWTISPDRTTYKFFLRDDIRFHDGTQLTADDVVYSLNSAIYSDSSAASKYLTIVDGYEKGLKEKKCAGVRAVAKHEFELKLARPYTPLMRLLASGALPIRKIQKDRDSFVGTGPYKIENGPKGLQLTAFSDYKGPYPPHLQIVNLIAQDNLLVSPNPVPRDQLPDFDISIMNETRLSSYPTNDYEIVRFPGAMIKAFYLHPSKNNDLKNRAVRFQVLSLLANALAKFPFDEKLNLKLSDIYPLGMLAHNSNRASFAKYKKAIESRPKPIKRALRLAHIGPASAFVRSMAEILEKDFKQSVELVPIEFAKIDESLKSGEFDVIAMSFKSIFLDPDTSLTPYDLVRAQDLSSRKAEYSKLRTLGSTAVLDQERIEIYGRLADLIFDEGLFLPISQAVEHQAISKQFKYKKVTYKYTPSFSDLE